DRCALSDVPCAGHRACGVRDARIGCHARRGGSRILSRRNCSVQRIALPACADRRARAWDRDPVRRRRVSHRMDPARLGHDEDRRMSGMAKECVIVVGAGIAGLGAALALGDGTREITILDRDPPPPDLSPDEAFYRWERKGATQLRHSHAFIGKLTALIRERYPDLLTELL